MLLSMSRKFIFIHIPKTAGSSMNRLLFPYCDRPPRSFKGSLYRRLPMQVDPRKAHFRNHDTALKVRTKLGADFFNSMHSFAVVRNPYDHAVSHYEYMKQYRSKRISKEFAQLSFVQYLNLRLKPRYPWHRVFAHLPDQTYFVVDKSENIVVNDVLHFETLQSDMAKLQARLKLEPVPLGHSNKTKSRKTSRSIQDYYGDEEVSLVNTLYDRDFSLFGYSRDLA